MNVRLLSYSQVPPVCSDDTIDTKLTKKQLKNVQDLIAFCARVSNPNNQYNSETAGKLIRYLVKNKHWSPLEMVSACLEIETTRDIGRQILRHRSFAFQEFSQRYADPTKDMKFEVRECRLQDSKNRQNSLVLDLNDPEQRELSDLWVEKQSKIIRDAKEIYEWAVSNGIAKEQARCVLPEGCTQSRMYMNGSLRSWVHYIDLRSKNGTQNEHIDIALGCAKEISYIFPMMYEFVNNN
ncbi:FAD-dependent thymidylate synthase [Candidatus Dojkabacteria bacterium]|jgi:thymidylate synthase (FAD)|nr:FAD-dependent thymidylate synthase [Candidatus Dojkabacteria bacterium]